MPESLERWFRDRFDTVDEEGDEYIVWDAENGKRTQARLPAMIQKFDGLDTTYEAFAGAVEPPNGRPEEQGVTWGNHVRAWRDQGRFD